MSYNIDTWRMKKLENLAIPMSALEKLDNPSFDRDTGELYWEGDLSEGFELVGKQEGDRLLVTAIKHRGEGSGHQFDTLINILKRSTGTLVVSLVWEGGDSLSRLVVKDGNVEHEDVDF